MRMKKWLVGLIGAPAVLVLAAFAVIGVPPHRIVDASRIGTGVAAKLGCSARYVTGLSEDQIDRDLSHYSPAMALIDLSFDIDAGLAEASLLGIARVQARHRDGLGCTLVRAEQSELDAVTVPQLPRSDALWPGGGSVQLNPTTTGMLRELLRRDNAAGLDTRALLLAQGGAIVGEVYSEGFDSNTVFIGWSMTKSLTAVMQGNLEMQGLAPVSEAHLFPQWQDDARSTVTLQDMLQMSSGIAFVESYVAASSVNQMLFVAPSASGLALGEVSERPPGSHFSYSSATTNLLNRWLQQQLGGTLQASLTHLRTDVLTPMGISQLVVEPDPNGVLVGSSYGYATARDWARIGQLMLNRGVINDHRVVTEDWVARATSPNRSANDPRYGYQFWLNRGGERLRWPPLPDDAFAMNGAQGQTVMIVPSNDAVIVRLGWTFGGYPMGERFAEVLRRVTE